MHRPGIEPGPPAWQASILPLNQRCYLKLQANVEEGLEPACKGGEKKISQSVGFEPTLPEGNWFLVSRLNHSATTAPQERIVFVGMWLKLFGYLSTTLYLKWEKSTIFFIFLCLQIILTCKKQYRLSNQLAVVTVIYKSSSKFQDSVFIPQ